MDVKIWIWSHYYDGTDNLYLYATEHEAKMAVFQYVGDQWNEGCMDDEQFTGNHDIDVPAYFDYHGDDESSQIYSQKVRNLPPPEGVSAPLSEEEVVLSSQECSATVSALSNATFKVVAADLGVSRHKANEIIESVIKKLET